jgi:transposase
VEQSPELARSIQLIVHQLHNTMARVREIEKHLTKWHRQSQVSRSIATVPGVGIKGASAIAATVIDPSPVPLRPRVRGSRPGCNTAAELERR